MRFRRLFRFTSRTDDEIERDIREEVAFHLDLRVRELVEAGSSPERAQVEAQRQFGNVDATAAYIRSLDTRKETRMRWRLRAEELQQDLTYGVRMLVRQRWCGGGRARPPPPPCRPAPQVVWGGPASRFRTTGTCASRLAHLHRRV